MQLLNEPCDQRRDYLWARSAPSLMRSAAASFDTLLAAPAPLTARPGASPHRRLGLYYEDLIAALLNDTLAPEPVYRNLQCVQDGITAGEFDFLYRCAGQWFHLETAVKFYLCRGNGSALSDFVGPGRRDRLDIKWQRLQQHQLALASHPAGRGALGRLGIEHPQPCLLMPGYLFYRAGKNVLDSTLHAEISTEHLRGWWLPFGELERLQRGPEHRYAVLPKLGWLSPARRGETETLDWQDLRAHLLQQPEPALVAQLSRLSLEGSHCWGETGRGFVVPNHWDHLPLAPRT